MNELSLPSDTLFEILLRVDHKTLILLCQVNKHITNICSTENFWKQKLIFDFDQIKHLQRVGYDLDFVMKSKPSSIPFRKFYFNLITDRMHLIKIDFSAIQLAPEILWIFASNSYNDIERMVKKTVQDPFANSLIPILFEIKFTDGETRLKFGGLYANVALKELVNTHGTSLWDRLTDIIVQTRSLKCSPPITIDKNTLAVDMYNHFSPK